MVADEPPSIQLLLNSSEQPYLQAGQLGPPSLRFGEEAHQKFPGKANASPQWWLEGHNGREGSHADTSNEQQCDDQ
jgi:hypothetical protein